MSFVHLHNHSYFSLLDGLSRPTEMVQRVAELEQPAIAITDHGSLSGLFQLWKACQGTGVKPIAGCEFYIAPSSRTTKEAYYLGTPEQRSDDLSYGAYGHITVVAYTAEGVRNLYRMQAEAFATGFWHKPRIDLELLQQHKEGLICLTGCPGGLLSTAIRIGQLDYAKAHLRQLLDIFGDKLYIEIMAHGIDFEKELNGHLLSFSKEYEIPAVVTGDSHFVYPQQSRVHSALLCIQTRSQLSNPKFQFTGSGYHIASVTEMERLLDAAQLPHSLIQTTCEVGDAVESYDSIFEHRLRMPVWGNNSHEEIENRVKAWLADNDSDDYWRRATYELDTIISLGFADYFLVLADILEEARESGIRIGPGRGSAGGSLVAYALGITQLDPISSGLLFERFLNPDRVGLPDVDIDIQEDRREEVLDIARNKYGEECVASLGTFGTVGAKAALKDSVRVHGLSFSDGVERTRHLPPPKFGRSPTLAEYSGLRDDIYDLAVELEGTVRSESVHAAAVVISPEPLKDIIPLRRAGGKGNWITGYDMHEIEALGLLKIDFLGLRTLKVIDDCQRMLETGRSGSRCILPSNPEECTDAETFRLLSSGNTLGVFQLDSPGMRRLLQSVAPESFRDITAVLSLYRPGPMGAGAERSYAARKNNRERIDFPHPELEKSLASILDKTYGLIVYQEQVLEILAVVGGYTYGSAELIFNAMRKKQHDKMEAAKPDFIARMKMRGYSDAAIEALWETLVPFADYSFNLSHATGYALIAYWTAYLKTHYPVEYMCALLSNEPDPDKSAEYLHECERMGIEVLPPDINESDQGFTATASGIRYGLSKIKGVGVKAVNSIIGKRPFHNLADYFGRVPAVGLNLGTFTALAKAGAFDGMCNREGLIEVAEKYVEKASSARKAARSGQRGVVKVRYPVKNKSINLKKRQEWEKETLGVELSIGSVVLCPNEPLTTPAFEWLRRVVQSYPGRYPLKIDFGMGIPHYTLPYKIDLNSAQRALESLGVRIREEL